SLWRSRSDGRRKAVRLRLDLQWGGNKTAPFEFSRQWRGMRSSSPFLYTNRYMISDGHQRAMAGVSEVDAGGLEAGFSSAKKQILLTLKRRGAVSLSDMSAELRISKMATLKHLNVLEAKGLVERSFKAGGRGRPRAFFNLSKNSATLFPEAYTHMTLCALNFIEEKLEREAVVRLLKQRER